MNSLSARWRQVTCETNKISLILSCSSNWIAHTCSEPASELLKSTSAQLGNICGGCFCWYNYKVSPNSKKFLLVPTCGGRLVKVWPEGRSLPQILHPLWSGHRGDTRLHSSKSLFLQGWPDAPTSLPETWLPSHLASLHDPSKSPTSHS